MEQKNSKQLNPPDLADVMESLKSEIFKTLNAVQVGQIEEFDATTQTATVRLAIKQVVDNVDGVKRLQEYPLLLQLPVHVASGGGAHITFPIANGDGCIVLFNDRDLENWFFDGGVNAPNTFRRHDLSDGLALVGFNNLQKSISGYITDGIELLFDENNNVQIKEDTIEVLTPLLKLTGNQQIIGGLAISGTISNLAGGSTPIVISSPVEVQNSLETTGILKAGNGASGTFTSVTVVNGIVTGGS